MKRPIVAGIVGGVASGKSEVTRLLQERGAHVIHADAIGHRVLLEPSVRDAVVNHFGQSILASDGVQIDRSRLATMVFGTTPEATQNRRWLESVVHPLIRARISDELEREIARGVHPLIVLDVPLLIESGWIDHCQRVLMVEADEAVRLERAKKRGWTEASFRDREASQRSLADKRSAATDTVDNSGSLEALERQVAELVARWNRDAQ
ncbi:MAG: dephospho-CoA kinase [Pirellula sp.]